MAIKTMRRGGFLYTLPLTGKSQYYHKEVNGKYTIAYKLHITLSAENYKRDRKIVASFLHKHGHYFKMNALRDIRRDEDRAFTIYATTKTDLLDVVAGIIKLHEKYKLTPGKPSKNGPIVPGTSNLVTYHVERVFRALLEDMAEADAFSERSKQKLYIRGALSELKVDEIVSDENKGYLHGGYASVRLDAMKFLMGGGPLVFLWNTESTL